MLYQQQNYTAQANMFRQDEVKFQIIKYLKQTSAILYYFGIETTESA